MRVAGDADERVEQAADDSRHGERKADLPVAEVEVVPDQRPRGRTRSPDELVEQLDRE
jgi:hypothetical protein